ncbi:DUF192 domain-containing protein [Sphingomonas aracearum]|uniref:DUF192 domain-containing protein n=1 Tax=Sphingomonas aracearum TaxID=2283317 RepID=A0A369VXW4_9SPHN|nr:DUF192 domain-containing protein [Sphingomonas aracearum]RDE06973.1 DUF192 domain-containing protein [Sphingomonas aracearum]
MMLRRPRAAFLPALAAGLIAAALPGCTPGTANATAEAKQTLLPVTVTGAKGVHTFKVEVAKTPAEQERGLMFRTDIPQDGGMLFYPYPAAGGPPQVASFWMKNTPSALDLIFIRADGTIATIAENAVPFSEAPIGSGEPVAAVLELLGGRAAALGIAEGDKVSWPK